MIAVGITLSVAEFMVMSLLVGKGTISGYQNGLLAGGGVVAVVVILVWLATSILKPEVPGAETASEGPAPKTAQ